MSGGQLDNKRKRRIPRNRPIWAGISVALLVVLCFSSISAVVVADQTTALGMVYLRAVNAGGGRFAEILGDHFSDDQGWHQRFYKVDIQRDLGYLQGAQLSDVTSSREQTLSGQWVTVIRYKWRPAGSQGDWLSGALRVKTDNWFFLTYINAVEIIE